MQNDEKPKIPLHTIDELPFKSIFDPRGPPPADLELWLSTPKDSDISRFGPVLYSSKLRKKSKQMGIYITRFYFLFPKYIAYGNSNNPSKIKKFIELEGLKVRVTRKPSKTKGVEKHYFTLYRQKLSVELVTKDKVIAENWREYFGRLCIMLEFGKFYSTHEILGKGAHGKVLLAENLDKTRRFAVKVFDKAMILTQFRGWQNLVNEVQILRKLNREDVIKLHEVYESDTEIHLVLEYVTGGDLHTRLRRKGQYGEKKAIALVKNLLEVVAFLHGQGLVHRDIKPANIVLSNMESDTGIKLIDFGFSMEIEKCKDLNLRCGTPGYVAPEVLSPCIAYPISEKVDIFSIGTIFYQLIAGVKLFGGKSNRQVLSNNKKCVIDLTKLARSDVSKDALDLLMRMLERNPGNRISAAEALEHSLFTKYVASSAEIADDDSHILPMPQMVKYSFDMGALKETNINSHSKIIDTYGTFYVTPHISLDALESVGGFGGRLKQIAQKNLTPNLTPRSSRKGSGHSSKRGVTPESWDDSGDEEAKTDRRSQSPETTPRLARKQTLSGQSPIHKVAIMNNVKKLNLVKEETMGHTEEDTESQEEIMPAFNLLGTAVK